MQRNEQADAKRQKTNLQKRLATRRQATAVIVDATRPESQQAAAKAAALADSAEEAERNALEQSLLDEASRFQSEVRAYERSVQNTLVSAKVAGNRAAVAAGAGVARASPAGLVEATTEETTKSLRTVHERAIAAMELQKESRRRVAAGKLAQRREAARAARVETLRAAGKSDEDIAEELTEVSTLYTC